MALSGPGGTWKTSRDEWGPLPVIAWQVWYDDGECVKAVDPNDLPKHGVQVVVAHQPGGNRTIQTSCDEYVVGGVHLIATEMPTLAEYQAIRDRAHADSWRP